MASYSYRICLTLAAAVVAAYSFLAAIPITAIAWVRDMLVGLVDMRPFRDLFYSPAFAFAGPAQTPIDGALLHRNRHEAGLARLGTVRHL